ncbi:MAG: TonB-dependent receptor [Candidatus Marinimicrobia bacterium]|nr:TonB-dependent receptor [Candidatus Neomarinimicrobiota bacterium]
MISLLTLLLSLGSNAQATDQLKGRVWDANNQQPVPGVEIKVDASSIASTSDDDGYYEIDLNSFDTEQIRFSHIGYQDQIIEILRDGEILESLDVYLQPTILHGNEVMVTATRTSRSLAQIPGRAEVILSADFNHTTATRIDAALQRIPGINIHRTSGDYEVRPVISMRGVGGGDPGRTLVLVDGVPLNKSDTGVANLKRIQMQRIDRVEILKGAGSALYGASAMGGVINILTRPAPDNFSGQIDFHSGTHNTKNINMSLARRFDNGIELSLSGYDGKGDGYLDIPDTLQDQYTVPLFFNETGGSVRLGLNRSPALAVKLSYSIDMDKRGEGYKIEHELGNHRDFTTENFQLNLKGKLSVGHYDISAYIQQEDYLRVSEAFKKATYNRFDVKSNRLDRGIHALLSSEVGFLHTLTAGLEGKLGSVDGGDYYLTSPDTILNRGEMIFLSAYVQDEIQLLDKRLRLLASLRQDHVTFQNGSFSANQTNNAFYAYSGELDDHSWSAWSPRIGLRYVSSAQLSAYANYSRGFRAAPLDDICRSGFMRLGPKIANPELGPETIRSVELGLDYSPNTSFSLAPSFYFSQGEDFLYYVATGDSLWGRSPIFKRENVTSVEIVGSELEMAIKPYSNLQISAHLTLNKSTIDVFNENPELQGNDLIFSPRKQTGLNLFWEPSWASITLDLHYKGEQFLDDANVEKLPAYALLDMFVSKTLWEHVQLTMGIVNMGDKRYLENLERLSPGRLYQFQASYEW